MKIIILALGLLLSTSVSALAQTATAVQLPNGFTQFLDANGKPLAGGTVYFYVPGTTTAKTTWQDPYQTILNSDPIVLNASGEALIWGSGIYREQVFDQNANLIWDQLTGGYNCIGGGTGSPASPFNSIQYNSGGVFAGLALGTTTTLLHGNAAGVATWSQVNLGTDITGGGTGVPAALAVATNGSGGMALVNGAIVAGDCLKWNVSLGITDSGGTCPQGNAPAGATNSLQYNAGGTFGGLSLGGVFQVLHGNPSGLPTWSGVAISTDVSGLGANVAANLANAATGSGSPVFATSPILITPNLGNALFPTLASSGSAPTTTLSGGTCAGAATAGAQTSVGTVTLTGACAAGNTIALSAMPAVAHSYVCFMSNRNTPGTLLVETTGTTTGATMTVSGTTSGSTDVIQYSCLGF